jgi:hypothetical protein
MRNQLWADEEIQGAKLQASSPERFEIFYLDVFDHVGKGSNQ